MANNPYDDGDFFAAYAGMPRSREGLAGAGEWRQLRDLFPKDLAGKAVLDLGCGYGWHCQYAVERGAARVLGLDLSKKMVAEARRRNAGALIEYAVCDLTDYAYPEAAYDLVVSNLALHYVADLDDIYRRVYRTLKPGGTFLFNIEHPVFTSGVNQEWIRDERGEALYWPIDRYFYPGERTTRFLGRTVLKQHHTLTQILGGLLRAGFALEAVEEALPPADMAEEMRRPMMLLVRAGR